MQKLKNILLFTGFILTGVAATAYLILLYIIIVGFETKIESNKLMIFLIIGSVAGIAITISMRMQGILFAKNEDKSKKVLNEYNALIGKDLETKLRPLWQFHLINALSDIFTKGITVFMTLYFSITIIVEGMGDFKYFGLGLINVIMYIGIGILALTKAYNFYLENEIPLLQQKIIRLKKKGIDDDELPRKLEEDNQDIVRECDRIEGLGEVSELGK